MSKKYILFFLIFSLISIQIFAQESYEVQVYSSDVMPVNTTIFELHSNVSPQGPKTENNFSNPLHETVEITTGIAKNWELGVYFFNRVNNGTMSYNGSHIRPRFSVPQSWKWKLSASLSAEFGMVKEENNWVFDYEIRPIFDKTIGKNYFAFNPTIDGNFTTNDISFSPNIKYSYKLKPKYSLGLEYYGNVGKPFNWDNYNLQTHQLYIVTDLFLHPEYECNFGIGYGLTNSSDVWNIKLILGKKICWKKVNSNK